VVLRLFRQEGFLGREECVAIRRGMDLGESETAEILGRGIHREVDVRVAALIDPDPDVVRDVELTLESCRDRVTAALGMALSEREGAGFVRYPDGGFYRPHRDRADNPEWDAAARRAVALVLFLNTSRDSGLEGEFDGGVLRLFFAQGQVDVAPEAGLLVAFPADVLHEVTDVRGGTRDAIVDWFYGPG
jgi:predicted 2-oxoglutarate/Fe(II)-dependent dioxygenase YbiX